MATLRVLGFGPESMPRLIDGRSAAAQLRSSYDYVIVGSGSAGSVIASRIAAAGSDRVLLLEAGPSDRHIYIRMPAALGMPLADDRFNWLYQSEPEPELDDRRIAEARGRVLGGSSSINGMNWVRGNPVGLRQLGVAGPERLELCRLSALFPPRRDIRRRGRSVSRRQRSDADRDLSGRKPALPRVHRGGHCRPATSMSPITMPSARRASTSRNATSTTASAGARRRPTCMLHRRVPIST